MIAARSETPRFRGLVVLIVEDHQDSRELLAQLLLHEHAIVLAAHNAQAALAMLEARVPDIILTDVRMPGMDGLAFARRVKTDARWTGVPIVAITALASRHDLGTTWEAGFAAHITKPIDWECLVRTIDQVLPRGRARSPRPRRRREA
jgi:CheY-like chemotaxis protein